MGSEALIKTAVDAGVRAAPRPAAVFAAVVALNVISVATFDVLPTVVEGATQTLRFSAREIGVLSALFMTGSTLGSLLAKYWVRRIAWPIATRVALVGIIAANALSALLHARGAFIAMQCLVGAFSGSLYSLTLTMLSDGKNPDRDFGLVIAAQVLLQAVGLLAGPLLLRIGGIDALLIAFVAITATGFLAAGTLPERGRAVPQSVAFRSLLKPSTTAALTGCFFFFLNTGCYWTFIELIGHDAGFTVSEISRSLVIGVGAGLIGALSAAWGGTRFSRQLMLWIGTVMVVAAVALLVGRAGILAFTLSSCLLNFAWNFSVAYQYAAVNASDTSGHAIALAPAFCTVGAAAGPGVAALLMAPHEYTIVLWLVGGGVVVSQLCFVAAGVLARRASMPAY